MLTAELRRSITSVNSVRGLTDFILICNGLNNSERQGEQFDHRKFQDSYCIFLMSAGAASAEGLLGLLALELLLLSFGSRLVLIIYSDLPICRSGSDSA